MNLETSQALFKLYPQIAVLRGDEAFDANGNQVQYDLAAVTTQAQKDACKAQAKALLAASDWSVLPDVGLTNSAEYVAYRTTLRNLVITPVANAVMPTEPEPIWS